MMIRFLLLWTLMGAVLVQAQPIPQIFPKDSVLTVLTKIGSVVYVYNVCCFS
ncbi:MAG: hypothetical protein ACK4GN_04890 [Runella sp.]